MNPTAASSLRPSEPGAARWRFHFLDFDDAPAVAAYEALLYRHFAPVLPINPPIRDLWAWDDVRGRLRTRAPRTNRLVALITDVRSDELVFAATTNTDVDAFWQSGAYGFAAPAPEERACEFLVTAGARVDAMVLVRHFTHGFLFGTLLEHGFACAYSTTADHLRWLYRRMGGDFVDEHTCDGHRRTLVRWDLARLHDR